VIPSGSENPSKARAASQRAFPRETDNTWESRALAALVYRNRALGMLALAAWVSVGSWIAVKSWWPTVREPMPADFVIEINQATAAELNLLPGIGPKSVDAILAYRHANGGFESIEELTRIPGIKEGKLRNLRPYITVDPHYAKR
jgi:competence ComEA-like helix-hairpin-helix protein